MIAKELFPLLTIHQSSNHCLMHEETRSRETLEENLAFLPQYFQFFQTGARGVLSFDTYLGGNST